MIAFDPETVRALANILVETGLTEIEVENKEGSIRVVRAPPTVMAPTVVASMPVIAAPVAVAHPATAAQAAAEPPSENVVNSPMVGIVYLSAEPGSAPFVTVGQSVVVGQTLLLIEAMKTFNQIKAPRAGTVTRILIAAGAPVEYGEPLLILE